MKTVDMLACRRTIELLPWLANGTLAEAERQRVDAHLAECASCRREAELFAAIIDTMPEAHPVHAEAAPFSRLLGRINREERQHRRWKLAAAVTLALGAVIALALPAYLLEPRYQTVSTALPEHVQRVQVQVQLVANNEVATLAELLARYDADVVAGPGEDGRYVLEFRLPAGANARALERELRGDARVRAINVLGEPR